MAVGFYSKNDMVPAGLLRKGRKERAVELVKSKSRKKVAKGNLEK
jgi:hypothetical protein